MTCISGVVLPPGRRPAAVVGCLHTRAVVPARARQGAAAAIADGHHEQLSQIRRLRVPCRWVRQHLTAFEGRANHAAPAHALSLGHQAMENPLRGGWFPAERWQRRHDCRRQQPLPLVRTSLLPCDSDSTMTVVLHPDQQQHVAMYLPQHTCLLCVSTIAIQHQNCHLAGETKPFADQLTDRLGGDKGKAEASLGLRAFIDRNGLKPGDDSVKVRHSCHCRLPYQSHVQDSSVCSSSDCLPVHAGDEIGTSCTSWYCPAR